MQVVAIAGVGLIGGSFALALRKAGFRGRIIGVSSPAAIREALRLGVIDEALPLEEAAAWSDLIYLSQPILRILDTIRRLDAIVRPGALITDAGSTKGEIVRCASEHIRRGRFLGGHPMAGKESRGVAEAEADLFRGRTYVLTPAAPAELEAPAAAELVDWIRRIGARPLVLDPDHHDRVVAFTSHLPQLVSTALAATLAGQTQLDALEQVAGPGLRDTTRLALSPFEIWRDILATNREPIRQALAAYLETLEGVWTKLGEDLGPDFQAGAEFAARLRERQASPPPDFEKGGAGR
jgi:prephenate dehydrogenase